MNKQTKLLMMAVSTTAIVFFSYKFYKTWKVVKEELEEQEMVDEIQNDIDIVAEAKEKIEEREDTFVMYDRDTVVEVDSNKTDYTNFFGVEDVEDYIEEEDSEEKLMYPPSSLEALEQWRAMRLADIHQETTLQTIKMLFGYRFIPSCEKDENVLRRIIDDKMQFFGPSSCWIDDDEVSIADLIIHYAYMMTYDLGNDINMNATVLANNFQAGFEMIGCDISEAIHALCMHTLAVNSSGEGLFAIYHGNEPTSFEDDYFKYIEGAV